MRILCHLSDYDVQFDALPSDWQAVFLPSHHLDDTNLLDVIMRHLTQDSTIVAVMLPAAFAIMQHLDALKSHAIILVHDDESLAMKAWELGVDDYLVTPITPDKLTNSLAKISQPTLATLSWHTQNQPTNHLITNNKHGTKLIDVSNIYYIIADHKYLTVHHTQGTTLFGGTLKSLANAHPTLLRIHRNTLINPAYLHAIDQQLGQVMAVVADDAHKFYQPLPISRRALPSVRKWLRKAF
ncbi:LytTR family DNA-binding domain-containing protein [Moraxella sp.]|uniref:LytR/AlgR family response regulator transcription factor n=1 Tax=Moraxella sp. TaxID=479 RepID=UPI0026DD21F9|nr:response regulator transcription factor [Moraxella sp.]MDO4894834.1 response regulator transcription factor [Moraxella sp.]